MDSGLKLPAGRTATFIVAAFDALDHVKAQADYVCDGTSDEVEIQAAIDKLSITGGDIQLTEGDFDIGGTGFIVRGANRINIKGRGFATDLNQSPGAPGPMITYDFAALVCCHDLSNMRINGNATAVTPAIWIKANTADFNMLDIWINGNDFACVQIDTGWDAVFENVIFESADGYGIYQTNGSGGIINDCSFYDLKQALHLENGEPYRWLISNSRLYWTDEHVIWAESPQLLEINNCIVGSAGGKSATHNTYDDLSLIAEAGVGWGGRVLISNTSMGGYAGGANLPRYAIGIDRNGESLSSVCLVVTGCTFYGVGTNQRKLDTTLDMKNVSISNVTGKWNILSTSQYKEILVRTDALTETLVGTGASTLYEDGLVRLRTGVNVNSSAMRSTGVLYGLSHQGYNMPTWDFPHNPSYIKFDVIRDADGDSPTSYIHFKNGNVIGDLAAIGFGLKISGYDLYAEVHDGGTRTATPLLTMTTLRTYQVEILHMQTHLYYIVDHIVYLVQTANVLGGNIASPQITLAHSTVNAGDCSLRVGQMRIKRMEVYP